MEAKRAAKKPETINDLIKITDKANPKPADLERLRKRLDDNDYLVRLNEVSEQAFNRVINTMTTSVM